MSKKNENFRRLAIKRVNNVMKYMRLIGNLSNTASYEFTEAEVKKIFDTLDEELNDCRSLFAKALKKNTRMKITLFDDL